MIAASGRTRSGAAFARNRDNGVLDVPGAGFGYRNFGCSSVRRAFVGLVGREHARLS
jgi:hypothetical protein